MFYLSYYLKVLLKPVTFSKGYTDYQTGNRSTPKIVASYLFLQPLKPETSKWYTIYCVLGVAYQETTFRTKIGRVLF